MKKIKKITVAILLVVALTCFAVGLGACSNNKIELSVKSPTIIYRIEDNADCFDFFECNQDVDLSFSVSVNGATGEAIEGHTIYLAVPGTYEVSCTATKGKKSVTETTSFNVFDKKSHMVLTNTEAQVDLNDRLSMLRVMALSGYVILSEVEHEEYISTVKIYKNGNDAPTVYDIVDGEATEDKFFDGTRFKFIYECKYVFTIVSETSGGKATAELTVIARENFSHIPLVEDVDVTYNEQTRTVTWGEIDGAISYRVKVDLKSVDVGLERTLDIDSYLVSEFQYFDLIIIAKNADGEEFAKLVVEDVVTAPEGSERLVVGNGAQVDPTTKTVVLSGQQAAQASSASPGISRMKNSYVAYAGDYGVGTYVEFTFKGNNLPNVCFFADQINANMTSDGGTGYILMNGLYSEYRGTSTSLTAVAGEHRLVCVGPIRMRIGGGRTDPLHNYIAVSEQATAYTVSENTLFSQKYLREDLSARTYRYVVGSFEKYGRLAFEVILYDADNGQLVEIANFVTETKIEDVQPGHIIAYASVKGRGDDTTFIYSKLPYQGTPNDRSLYWQEVTESKDGTVTIEGAEIKGAGYTSQMTDVSGTSDLSVGHVGIKGEFGIGTYIDVNFKGNNMPNVMFFADDINDDLTSKGGKGVLVASGIKASVGGGTWRGESSLYVFGPNRIPMAYDKEGGLDATTHDSTTHGYVYGSGKMPKVGSVSYNDYPLLTTKGLLEDQSGKEYKLTLGTYLNVNDYLSIEVILTDVATGNVIYDTQIVTDIEKNQITAGSIVLYGGVKGENEKTTFSFSEPYQSKPDDVKLASNGASKNSDGTITLAGRGVAGAGHLYQVTAVDNSYVAILGDYGVGTYMDFTFKGNNMPTVMYFANEINGNMGNADVTLTPTGGYLSHTSLGYKGMIFTNGFYMENTNGGHDFYRVYGMNRIYRESSLSGSYRDDKNYLISKKYGVDTDFNALTQLGLMTDYEQTNFKYTVGTYDDNGKVAIDVTLVNLDNNQTVAQLKYTTSIDVSTVVADNIIIYGCVKGSQNSTTFAYNAPYTKNA